MLRMLGKSIWCRKIDVYLSCNVPRKQQWFYMKLDSPEIMNRYLLIFIWDSSFRGNLISEPPLTKATWCFHKLFKLIITPLLIQSCVVISKRLPQNVSDKLVRNLIVNIACCIGEECQSTLFKMTTGISRNLAALRELTRPTYFG